MFLISNCFARELPETPAGRRAQEVVELLNNTSSYELGNYIETQYAPGFKDAFPLAAHKGIVQTTQTMFGRVKVVEITESTYDEIRIVLESESRDAWLNLDIQVEPDDPHRIVRLGLRPGERPHGKNMEEEKNQQGQETREVEPPRDIEIPFSNFEELHQYLLEKSAANEF